MNLRPLGDRVLIRPDQNPEQTESGLHLVEHYKPEQTGTIVAVGDFCEPVVAVGDAVIFSWSVGYELFVGEVGERFLIMRETDILAVIEQTETEAA